ncbi:MAG: sulfur carrier protein ThiS [Deltaproteobacteria bacterium]|nr:MAG: sulfur carrier protein ThiS [Deltaproteobacteria bacterium]
MITITVNGQIQTFDSEISLSTLLSQLKIENKALAIAINAEIISHSQFETHTIRHNDVIELIRAVGGG